MQETLTELLLKKEYVLLMAGTYIIMQVIVSLLPQKVTKNQVWARLAPIMPILLCSAGIWIPGLRPDGATLADTVLTGLVLGYAVAHTYKTVLQTILGKDQRILEAKNGKAP